MTLSVTTMNRLRALLILLIISSATSSSPSNNCLEDLSSGPCKRSITSCRPDVTVVSSTHLRLNWLKVFLNCARSQVKAVTLVHTTSDETIEKVIDFDEKVIEITADPCVTHDFRIEILFEQSYQLQYEQTALLSLQQKYNEEDTAISHYPYQGLINSQIISGICLKESGDFSVPSPPESLKNCKVRSDFTKTTVKSGNVKVSFKSPTSSQQTSSLDVNVDNIEKCFCKIPEAKPESETNSKSESESCSCGGWVTGFVIAMCTLGLLVLFIVWQRKMFGREIKTLVLSANESDHESVEAHRLRSK